MRGDWHFGLLRDGVLRPNSSTYNQEHVDHWMRAQGTAERTLVDLIDLKIVASDEGDELYLWWKEN